jgi:hypothetical protein
MSDGGTRDVLLIVSWLTKRYRKAVGRVSGCHFRDRSRRNRHDHRRHARAGLHRGAAYQNIAEPVSITSVAGTTIGITAALYPHVQGAPVSVPVSAAFLNQQVRDTSNFLAYPPLCRAVAQTTQSIAATTSPAGTQGHEPRFDAG